MKIFFLQYLVNILKLGIGIKILLQKLDDFAAKRVCGKLGRQKAAFLLRAQGVFAQKLNEHQLQTQENALLAAREMVLRAKEDALNEQALVGKVKGLCGFMDDGRNMLLDGK